MKALIGAIAFLVVAAVIGYVGIWKWMVCRTYVPKGKSMIVNKKTGKRAAKDSYAGEGEMGVREELASPGRHFFNPWTVTTQMIDDVVIKPEQIGVIKSNVGKDLPPDRFLAGPGEKGTQEKILTPGVWRINTYGQSVEIEQNTALIKPGYIGVQTLREGPKKGVQAEVLQPGYYHINPRKIRIDVVEIGYRVLSIHTEFTRVGRTLEPVKNTGVSFPLADGKEMYIDFTVVWGVFPKEAPRVIKDYGTIEMVESKIIVPQVLSICKNTGSNFTTMQFIEGESREQFQEEVTTELKKMGQQKGIHVLIALVRGFHPAADIKATIQARLIAEEEKKTLLIEQETDKVSANLERAKKIVDIALKDFDAQTVAKVAEEREIGLKKAAEIKADADRTVAGLNKDKANIEAEILKISGQAEADVIEATKKADATKLALQIAAFGGPAAYNLFTFAQALPADLKIKYRYAGPGTLWTDAGGSLQESAAKKMLEYFQQKETPAKPKRR